MKALIRREGETVTEQDGIECIDWTTGAPLTNTDWCGGSYTLVQNYTAPTGTEPETYTPAEVPAGQETDTPETIVVDGVIYNRAS